jgi:hypothetical protein
MQGSPNEITHTRMYKLRKNSTVSSAHIARLGNDSSSMIATVLFSHIHSIAFIPTRQAKLPRHRRFEQPELPHEIGLGGETSGEEEDRKEEIRARPALTRAAPPSALR